MTTSLASYERGSGRRWAFMRWHLIPDLEFPNETYLARLRIVQTPWFGIFLHHIKLPDKDRALHNHPWTFATFILKGWYDESTPVSRNPAGARKERRWNRWSWHGMSRDKFHAITNLSEGGTWTLVFVGPRVADWGYAVERKSGVGWRWIDHETYHKERLNA